MRNLLGLRLLCTSLALFPAFACGGSSKPGGSSDGGTRDATTGDARVTDANGNPDVVQGGDSGGPPGEGGPGAPDGSDGGAPDSAPPPCTTEAWSTYGHDGQRTFASGGCVTPAATLKWHYAPTAPAGRTFEAVYRAVAQSDGVFLGWMASDSPYTGTTAMDRVDATGARVWTWDSGTDTNLGNWPTIASTYIAVDDDGLYLLDPMMGTVTHGAGVDWWGQTIADPSRLYVVNQMQADGPGLFVGAVDDTTKVLWQQNLHQACGNSWGDNMGGIALDTGTLFYAPQYQVGGDAGASVVSGVYAFDAAAGTPKWNQPTSPQSAISVGSGLVYLVENAATLVARNETDGTVAWSASLVPDASFAQVGAQAPVLANGLAIVATSAGIVAFDASTGSPAWTSTVVAPAVAFPSIVTNGCGGNVPTGGARATTMAAALASGALVVTAPAGIDFVSLGDGHLMGTIQLDAGFSGAHDPVVVGNRLYVVDATGVDALE